MAERTWLGIAVEPGGRAAVAERKVPEAPGNAVFLTHDDGFFTVSDGGAVWESLGPGGDPPEELCEEMGTGRVVFAPNGVLYEDIEPEPEAALAAAVRVAEAGRRLADYLRGRPA